MNTNSDPRIEAAAKAGHEHTRTTRPETHGHFDTWEQLDESCRDYLRGIQRAALAAADAVEPPRQTCPICHHDTFIASDTYLGEPRTACTGCGAEWPTP